MRANPGQMAFRAHLSQGRGQDLERNEPGADRAELPSTFFAIDLRLWVRKRTTKHRSEGDSEQVLAIGPGMRPARRCYKRLPGGRSRYCFSAVIYDTGKGSGLRSITELLAARSCQAPWTMTWKAARVGSAELI